MLLYFVCVSILIKYRGCIWSTTLYGAETWTLRKGYQQYLEIVCFLLGNSPASEFYMLTFRNTLFHFHRRVGTYPAMKMKQTERSETSA